MTGKPASMARAISVALWFARERFTMNSPYSKLRQLITAYNVYRTPKDMASEGNISCTRFEVR
jgi:hypothetical protein